MSPFLTILVIHQYWLSSMVTMVIITNDVNKYHFHYLYITSSWKHRCFTWAGRRGMIRTTHIPRTNHTAPPSFCKNLYRFSSGPKKEIFGVFPEFFRYPPSYLRNSQKIPEDFFTPWGPAAEDLARSPT